MTRTRCYCTALLLTFACSESPQNGAATTSAASTTPPTTTVAPPPAPTPSAPAATSNVNPPAPPPVAPEPAQPTSTPTAVTPPVTPSATETSSEPADTVGTSSEPAPSSGPAAGGAESDDMGQSTAMQDTAGGVEPGACVKGSTKGNEVVFIGESFIDASAIPEETASLAIQNGSLAQGEQYLDFSVSGTRLGDGAIPRQYTQAQSQHPIRFVLMNGGGNDCLQAGDPNSPIPAAEKLYAEMAADGVEKVVYFFYPDSVGMFGGPGSQLQNCLEEYRPKIRELCNSLEAPKCYWLDLGETSWAGNEAAYTSDGIHPNGQGSKVTAEAIWETMVDNCVAQ